MTLDPFKVVRVIRLYLTLILVGERDPGVLSSLTLHRTSNQRMLLISCKFLISLMSKTTKKTVCFMLLNRRRYQRIYSNRLEVCVSLVKSIKKI